ncbi:Asp23/Gls24 family envelope stress response protein [Pseudonocardia xishanensis]|uniref:Asp23/Gls24 family envelope stress response protein n=1 Tax=Pseudonocardia xishanensis TaxID=630995 RepID=A0ABP8RSQ6_9PSEU
MIPPAPASRSAAEVARPAWAPDADDRGALDVDPVVLRKIVEYVSDQTPGTLHRERRVAGLDVGDAGPRARVSATVGENPSVDVRLDLTCAYPTPVRTTVAAVKERITTELDRLAGYQVRSLAVTVSGLRPPTGPVKPRIQ